MHFVKSVISQKLLEKVIINSMYLKVKAGVRYWEDAKINNVPDVEQKMPFIEGNYWCQIIDIEDGQVFNWPNITARIHYKVCDDGEYWILDDNFIEKQKYPGDYVPNILDCSIDQGSYGDYIIMTIDNKGYIYNWDKTKIKNFYVGE